MATRARTTLNELLEWKRGVRQKRIGGDEGESEEHTRGKEEETREKESLCRTRTV